MAAIWFSGHLQPRARWGGVFEFRGLEGQVVYLVLIQVV